MTIYQFISKFPTEESAISHFYQIRYNGILTCPHCGSTDKVYRCNNRIKACRCKNCDNMFSPFKDTIFEKSTTDLRKWFLAIHLLLNARKGFSAKHLQREIGVTYKTAWSMLNKIRLAMGNESDRKAFSKIVEVDETYIGGKGQKYPKSRSTGEYLKRPKRKLGRATDKPVVMGIKERESGRAYAQVMLFDVSVKGKAKRLSGPQLKAVIDKVCKDGCTVISDDYPGYKILDKKERIDISLLDGDAPPIPRYVHHTVCHKAGRFTAGPGIHTNGIEGFWAGLKRGHYGVYHSMSEKYLLGYLAEFCFRQSTRSLPPFEVFDLLLKQSVLK